MKDVNEKRSQRSRSHSSEKGKRGIKYELVQIVERKKFEKEERVHTRSARNQTIIEINKQSLVEDLNITPAIAVKDKADQKRSKSEDDDSGTDTRKKISRTKRGNKIKISVEKSKLIQEEEEEEEKEEEIIEIQSSEG